ncbi:MAG: hypothetical protein EP343_04010 [Deltaproteobacteria bacterium]|nr:MAG: hypothetical protein EP343_04010 [Deltaproteobacteria bacterium]
MGTKRVVLRRSRAKWIGMGSVLALFVMAAVYPTSLFEKGKRPLRQVRAGKVWTSKFHPLSAQQCKGCHRSVYRQWKKSRHAKAWTNRLFSVAFHHSPYQWCVHCHAPLLEQKKHVRGVWNRHRKMSSRQRIAKQNPSTRPTNPRTLAALKHAPNHHALEKALLREGINCASCHWRNGVLLAAKRPSKAAQNAHPIRWEPKLKRASFCAGCHQFNFTKKLTEPTQVMKTPVQNTYHAWQESFARKKGHTCQSCHMKEGEHSMPGAHSLAMLRRAIRPNIRWKSSRTLTVQLASQHVGHAIPTGDPFRRLVLEVCPSASCKTVWSRTTLRKTFVFRKGEWVKLRDSRIPVPTTQPTGLWTRTIQLPKQAKKVQRVFWRLRYFYAEFPHHRYLLPDEIAKTVYQGFIQRTKRSTSP